MLPSLGSFLVSASCSSSLNTDIPGYDTGVISGTLVVIGSDLGHALEDVEKVIVTKHSSLADVRN